MSKLPQNKENKGNVYLRIVGEDNNGNATYSSIKFININLLTNNTINIFPNPSNTFFNVELDQESIYELYTVEGKKIGFGGLDGKSSIGQDLPEGVYMLVLFFDFSSKYYKLIKY